MKLTDFLEQSSNPNFWKTHTSICFVGNNYPLIFFNNIFKNYQINKLLPAPYKNLPLNTTNSIQLMSNLQQSFLGQLNFYWLSECDIKATNKNNKTLDLLLTYKGPHFIAFYLNEEKINTKIKSQLKKILTVNIETSIDEQTFKKISSLLNQKIRPEHSSFLSKLFKNSTPTLDQVCMWKNYLKVISRKASNEVYKYLASIILEKNPSLNQLSQLFFAKKAKSFFDLWSKIHNEYPDMFWITFWSEQLFKAYYVVKFLNQKNFVQAKKISFRLPFSFINKDWKNFSLKELEKEHQFIYNNDFKIKTGSTYCFLDLFYLNHFTNQYNKEN